MEPKERFQQSLVKLQEILSSAPNMTEEEIFHLVQQSIIELESLAVIVSCFEKQVQFVRDGKWLKDGV